ncbi:sugar (pentulose or hexulose) kinase [Rhizomicrobium palustre]|uniref:Sugar (Pentulose or hexulose) kinase n=1 Tax=Rhizomicrobium palustre TaxID=189966 RepID=A0A846N1X4_9PROT|nr:carbohydrate kinase [Rhizomicrobium palustre]NIK89147.1 sugar (pentulose or hexulose) kinase [Rhizomicrobium palustre]
MRELTVVLDIGKSFAKLSLLSQNGEILGKNARPNASVTSTQGYPCLDVEGLESWLSETLSEFARKGRICRIMPVAHGASACLVQEDGTWLAPLDYEAALPAPLAEAYAKERDAFHLTGSPALPCGLNLGAQIFWMEQLAGEAFAKSTIVTWPQFWAWRLCGVAATETTSLGCHTDLWQPGTNIPSPMAQRRGWDKRLAPLYAAGDVLGTVTPEWQQRCGLPADCKVYCGLHDSNAALIAMRGFPEVKGREHTVLSTGTWFIAMHATLGKRALDLAALPEARDCLVNVDAFGAPVPSARFMGGRETEILEAAPVEQLDAGANGAALLDAAREVIAEGVFALPTFQTGVGPFGQSEGRWMRRPEEQLKRRAAISLYLALVTDTMLGLIGSTGPIVAEGRFAGDVVFMSTLAKLRPSQPIYAAPTSASVQYGALRLMFPELAPSETLAQTAANDLPIEDYAASWREMANQ